MERIKGEMKIAGTRKLDAEPEKEKDEREKKINKRKEWNNIIYHSDVSSKS